MTSEASKSKRPSSITFICVLGFIGAILTVQLVFSSVAQQIGAWYPPYLGLSALIGLACMIGLWLMRKWAVYTYAGFALINQVVLLVMGRWNIMALLIPAIVVFVGYKHLSKMP